MKSFFPFDLARRGEAEMMWMMSGAEQEFGGVVVARVGNIVFNLETDGSGVVEVTRATWRHASL